MQQSPPITPSNTNSTPLISAWLHLTALCRSTRPRSHREAALGKRRLARHHQQQWPDTAGNRPTPRLPVSHRGAARRNANNPRVNHQDNRREIQGKQP